MKSNLVSEFVGTFLYLMHTLSKSTSCFDFHPFLSWYQLGCHVGQDVEWRLNRDRLDQIIRDALIQEAAVRRIDRYASIKENDSQECDLLGKPWVGALSCRYAGMLYSRRHIGR